MKTPTRTRKSSTVPSAATGTIEGGARSGSRPSASRADSSNYERTILLPDLHCPFEDECAASTALAFVRHYKPHVVFVLGDWIDFYQLSRFDKDPRRGLQLQDDVDRCILWLGRTRKAAPDARIVYLRGNHEHRLTRFLWGNAAPLANLRNLSLPELLDFRANRIEYAETGQIMHHGFCLKHGNVVRARSGASATGELDKEGVSGASGHTHRLSQVYKRNRAGFWTWAECGCLCDLAPEYMEGQTPDWQHGLAFGSFKQGGERFELSTRAIVNGKLVYDGCEIKA